MIKNKIKNKKGFTLIELVIIIVLIGVCLPTLALLFVNLLGKVSEPEIRQVATALAEQEMERVIGARFLYVNNEPRTSLPGNFSKYSYQVIVGDVPSGEGGLIASADISHYKQVQVEVFHDVIGSVTLTTIVTKGNKL